MAVHDTVSRKYVRPESQRPRLADLVAAGTEIPVVDLACPDRAAVVATIGDACRSHGFFQVLNHGMDGGLTEAVMAVGRDFFRLAPEEKARLYSDDPARKMRLMPTSFNVRKETVRSWGDYLRLHCHPLDQFVPDWPFNPPNLRVLRLKEEEDGRVAYQLVATPIPQVPENMGGGLLELPNGILHALVVRSGDLRIDAAALVAREPGTPKHLGKNRAAVETLLGTRSPPYAIQVCVDESVSAKAGNPIGPEDKAVGADAGREHGHRGHGEKLSAVVGIVVASSAVAAVAPGVTPAVAFGLFVVLVGSLSLGHGQCPWRLRWLS